MSSHCHCFVDVEYDTYDLISHKTVRARKGHRCGECRGTIKPGEKYERFVGKDAGDVFTAKTCYLCLEIRDCYCCSYGFGRVWEDILTDMDDIPLGMLDPLSPEARQKFMDEFERGRDEEEV